MSGENQGTVEDVIHALRTENNGWSRDEIVMAPHVYQAQSLIMQAATVVARNLEGDAPSVLVPFAVPGEAAFTPEGEQLHESDPTLTQATIRTGKLSQLTALTNELARQPNSMSAVSRTIGVALRDAADKAFLTQAVTDPENPNLPVGLFEATPLTIADPITANLDPLVDAIAEMEFAGGSDLQILAGPGSWAALQRLKAGDSSNQPLLGTGNAAEAAERKLLGLPVYVNKFAPVDEILVIDRSIIAAVTGPIRVTFSDQRLFDIDSLSIRGTWRLGWTLIDDLRGIRVQVPTDDGGDGGDQGSGD